MVSIKGLTRVSTVVSITAMLCLSAGCGDRPAVETPERARTAAASVEPGTAPEAGDESGYLWEGRVVDDAQQPVAGAEVLAVTLEMPRDGATAIGIEILGRYRTESNGTFRCRFSEPDGEMLTMVAARDQEHGVGWLTHYAGASGPGRPTDHDLVLRPPAAVAGHVLDQEGQPVADAKIDAVLSGPGGAGPINVLYALDPFPWLRTRTDADGHFRLADVPEGAKVSLLIEAAGFAARDTFGGDAIEEIFPYQAGQGDIRLTLAPERRVQGRVERPDGARVPEGLTVAAMREERLNPFQRGAAAIADDGRFTIGGLASGRYAVRVAPGEPEGPQAWVATPVTVDLTSAQTATGVVLRLQEGALLEVEISGGDDGSPVAGANAVLTGGEEQTRLQLHTDTEGKARQRVLPGEYTLHSVHHADFVTLRMDQGISLIEGETRGLEIALQSKPRIRGRVTDPEGEWLSGVELVLLPDRRPVATSDESGSFSFVWEPRDQFIGSFMAAPGPSSLWARDEARNLALLQPLEGKAQSLELRLMPGAMLAGRVLASNGEAVPGAEVRLESSGLRSGTEFRDLSAQTDGNGRYRFSALALNRIYRLRVGEQGYGPGTTWVVCMDGAAQPVAVPDLVLQPADRHVAGRVVDGVGRPVTGVTVNTAGAGQPRQRATTGDDGRFTLTGICQGRVWVEAAQSRGAPAGAVATTAGSTNIQVVLGVGAEALRGSQDPEPAPSLVGRPMPALGLLGIEEGALDPAAAGLLLCFWDKDQRPSRHAVRQLALGAERLKQAGIQAFLVHGRSEDAAALDAWLEEEQVPFPSRAISRDADLVRFAFGVQGLPWLLFVDSRGQVRADGFGFDGLRAEFASRR